MFSVINLHSLHVYLCCFRHSQADVVLFMNMPISERNKEIVTKYNIRVIPFQLSDFSSEFQNYHPSTLRWVMMDNFFEVRISFPY